MLDRIEAGVIMDLLESATDSNWPNTVRGMVDERGYTPEEISEAWKSLEEIAGMCGCAPEPEDF